MYEHVIPLQKYCVPCEPRLKTDLRKIIIYFSYVLVENVKTVESVEIRTNAY